MDRIKYYLESIFGISYNLKIGYNMSRLFRMELIMKVRYNNLFKLLIDKKMKKTDLAKAAGLTPATLARLSKDEVVSMETIIKICECLDCRIEDVIELIPDSDV